MVIVLARPGRAYPWARKDRRRWPQHARPGWRTSTGLRPASARTEPDSAEDSVPLIGVWRFLCGPLLTVSTTSSGNGRNRVTVRAWVRPRRAEGCDPRPPRRMAATSAHLAEA